jgi:heme exporter protein A
LLWDGEPVSRDPARYRAALHYVGHLDATKPALTAREMLGFWVAMRGVERSALDRALDTFGLAARGDWPCRWLSAGQRKRLALARLIAAPAPVWLLDEPNAALDNDGEASLEAAIAEHRATGGRVAVATHQSLAIPGAVSIALDDFAPIQPDPTADWC